MATATEARTAEPAPALGESASAGQSFQWSCLGWEGYIHLLEARGGETRPRIIYLDGNAELVTTSSMHERLVDRLGVFVREVVEELDIPCVATRESNFKRKDLEAGVEPDDSFYLANYRSITTRFGIESIDLDVDPPPDLVLEIEYANSAKKSIEILRRLRVPEVWVCRRDGLRFLVFGEDGRYAEPESSHNFPFLAAAEVFEWVDRPGMDSSTQWIKELRRWVRETLLPRVRGQAG